MEFLHSLDPQPTFIMNNSDSPQYIYIATNALWTMSYIEEVASFLTISKT